MTVEITSDIVRKCLESVAPLTTPHRDGWRAEHPLPLCADQDCMAALTDPIGAPDSGDVSDATCDLLSSATLVVLLKKTDAEMEALKENQGAEYRHPQRPLGIGSAIPKRATCCVLEIIEAAIGVTTGAHRFAVSTKGGCDMVQWILQVIMEAEPDLARR